ncbi:MAG: hypothetical protein M3O61_03640 [Gemmatimonadota bacterium]|nr:hypothetical protein [Gemmatimonadota bacterium]
MTETEMKKRLAVLDAKVERAKDAYGQAAYAESEEGDESPRVARLRDEYESAQAARDRFEMAWEAGAKARHVAEKKSAEKQRQTKAKEMVKGVKVALSELVDAVFEIEKTLAPQVGAAAERYQAARSAVHQAIYRLPPGPERQVLVDQIVGFPKLEQLEKLFACVTDPRCGYQVTENLAVADYTRDEAGRMLYRARQIAGSEPEEAEEDSRPVRKSRKAPARDPRDPRAPGDTETFWVPGVRSVPSRTGVSLPFNMSPPDSGDLAHEHDPNL